MSDSERVHALFDYLTKAEDANYLGEDISQLQHSLQCALLAKENGADEDTILGALLHDIGQFLPSDPSKTPDMIAPGGTGSIGRMSHDKFGEAYLRQFGFSEKTCQLVGGHVIAKRYMTAVDPSYYDKLSISSKNTLKYQGGPMSEQEVAEANKDPWLREKLRVREWDDLAKRPDITAPPLKEYLNMAVNNVRANKV